jgi:hypothetical protein
MRVNADDDDMDGLFSLLGVWKLKLSFYVYCVGMSQT